MTGEAAPGRLIDVDGVMHHVLVHGTRGPVVVIESGLGGGVLEWAAVAQALADRAVVVCHDRPGLGWSGPADACADAAGRVPVRTAMVAATELRRLLKHLGLQGPYTLVGHSLGGVHVRAFAGLYPRGVAGVVLVDPSHEDQLSLLPRLATLTRWQIRLCRALLAVGPVGRGVLGAFVRKAYASECARPLSPFAADVLRRVGERLRRPTALRTMVGELAGLETSFTQIRALDVRSPFPPVPLRVISQGRQRSSGPMASMLPRWHALHARLCRLSPDSSHIVAERSGHLVPLEDPGVIVAAVAEVLGR